MPILPRGPVVVIGSINMDLVCRLSSRPVPGQTVLGEDFLQIPGGKGANQAVAAARLGGGVHLIGRVGDDNFGDRLLQNLKDNAVNTDRVTVTPKTSSGVAMIQVDAKGQNSIVVIPGANARLGKQDISAAEALIASASVVVMQLEIPLAVVRHTLKMCHRLGVFTILDPAPVPPDGLPEEFFSADIFTPNESEADALLHESSREVRPRELGAMLIEKGVKSAVLKRGAKGAVWVERDSIAHQCKGFKVKVVDSTAAGDAFTGALAVGQAEGMAPAAMLKFACAAGSLCCTRFGAQPSLPYRTEVDRLLR